MNNHKRVKGSISQPTIDKQLAGMNQILETILKNKGLVLGHDINAIKSKTNCNSSILTFMCAAGFITRIERGIYRANITCAEPIHARRVVELINNQAKVVKDDKSTIIPIVKPTKRAYKRKQLAPLNSPRTVSILWGLLKWSK